MRYSPTVMKLRALSLDFARDGELAEPKGAASRLGTFLTVVPLAPAIKGELGGQPRDLINAPVGHYGGPKKCLTFVKKWTIIPCTVSCKE
jgi:hypothetical protein